MYLVIGVLCLCFGALLFGITLLGSRNPTPQRWAGDNMVSMVIAPMLVGILAVGCASVFQAFLGSTRPDLKAWAISLAALAVTTVLILLLRIRKRLEAWSGPAGNGTILNVDFQAGGKKKQGENLKNSSKKLRKAA